MSSNRQKDLELFLNKVDDLEAIVKGLNSEDDSAVASAMKEADEMIAKIKLKDAREQDDYESKTVFNKTVINKSPTCSSQTRPTPGGGNPEALSQEAFMTAFERDAKERSERRAVDQKEANIIKDQGNEEFRAGNFEKALELYTQALSKFRDSSVLYTNRAQTLIKLSRYEEALSDCDWALRAYPNCVKAYVHQGHAYLAMKDYVKAKDSYTMIMELDSHKKTMVKEYISEVERAETAEKDEQKAQEVFDAGDVKAQGVVELLKHLNKSQQLPLFYSGGFRIIADNMSNTDERTLFRTHGGMQLPDTHYTLNRCLHASPKSLSKEELDLVTAALAMFNRACIDNEMNQRQLFINKDFGSLLLLFLEAKLKGEGRHVQASIINMLYTVSQSDVGRTEIVAHMEITRLLVCVSKLVQIRCALAVNGVASLNNLALNKGFRQHVCVKMDEVMSCFELLLATDQSNVLSLGISTVLNLATDIAIRKRFQKEKRLWDACLKILLLRVGSDRYLNSLTINFQKTIQTHYKEQLHRSVNQELTSTITGLLMNLTFDQCPCLEDFALAMTTPCLELCSRNYCPELIKQRCLGTLSHILPCSDVAVEFVCSRNGPDTFLRIIKENEGDLEVKPALKCLAACTQAHDIARQYIVDNKGLGTLIKMLKQNDEMCVGNAALCLSHCCQVPKVCAALTKTNVIEELLVLTRDEKRSAIQQNCAILIAKLAQGDKRHLEKLRELHGIEILHSCMKYIK